MGINPYFHWRNEVYFHGWVADWKRGVKYTCERHGGLTSDEKGISISDKKYAISAHFL